jgi:hypothetical protein
MFLLSDGPFNYYSGWNFMAQPSLADLVAEDNTENSFYQICDYCKLSQEALALKNYSL